MSPDAGSVPRVAGEQPEREVYAPPAPSATAPWGSYYEGERLAHAGLGPEVNWEGWRLVHARDLRLGEWVRLRGLQFEANPRGIGPDTLLFTVAGRPPIVVWGGCLVWTYVGI